MAIGVVEFSREGYKLERFLHKNQHTQRKLLNSEKCLKIRVLKILFFIFSEKNLKLNMAPINSIQFPLSMLILMQKPFSFYTPV